MTSWFGSLFNTWCSKLESYLRVFVGQGNRVITLEQQQLLATLETNKKLDQVISQLKLANEQLNDIAEELLTPPTNNPDKLDISEKLIGENMAGNKAGVDLQILDDGKGVRYTLTPTKNGAAVALPAGTAPPALNVVDANGTPSGALVLAPTAGDTTNLSFDGTLPTPAIDGTGFVAKFTYTFPDGDVLEGDAPAVDVVTDPKSSEPDAFVIQPSAL